MQMIKYPEAVLPYEHCSQCGADQPHTEDGYTCCCNEPACAGPAFGMSVWAVGRFTGDGSTSEQTGTIRACCAAAAEKSLPGDLLALWRERTGW